MENKKNITNIKIIFYSMYGHVFKLAEAIAKGASTIPDVQVSTFRVPELVPEKVLEQSGAKEAQKKFEHISIAAVSDLLDADAVIFGTPTRFGNMCAQMRNFLDQTGGIWLKGNLIGKVGSVFTSTASQHGGQETTLTSFHLTLLHHGMVIVGVPYSAPELVNMQEISGGTPYGATTIADHDGSRQPSANELKIAEFQGKHVAKIAKALKLGQLV
ncbi:MAG: TrpR binding protein WrbA [uncultured bacterium]|nr:MAG: TrpR binding protein WrbA [uncultured bacterium]